MEDSWPDLFFRDSSVTRRTEQFFSDTRDIFSPDINSFEILTHLSWMDWFQWKKKNILRSVTKGHVVATCSKDKIMHCSQQGTYWNNTSCCTRRALAYTRGRVAATCIRYMIGNWPLCEQYIVLSLLPVTSCGPIFNVWLFPFLSSSVYSKNRFMLNWVSICPFGWFLVEM